MKFITVQNLFICFNHGLRQHRHTSTQIVSLTSTAFFIIFPTDLCLMYATHSVKKRLAFVRWWNLQIYMKNSVHKNSCILNKIFTNWDRCNFVQRFFNTFQKLIRFWTHIYWIWLVYPEKKNLSINSQASSRHENILRLWNETALSCFLIWSIAYALECF